MPNPIDNLQSIRRPRLLIRAARHGALEYNRNRDLKRLLRQESLPSPIRALRRLMDIEADLEGTRQAGSSDYSVGRHVDVLIAVMGEARLVPDPISCG